MNTNINIRRATKNDYSFCQNFSFLLHEEHVKARKDIYRKNDNPMPEERFFKILDDSENIFLVIEDLQNKKVFGYIFCRKTFRDETPFLEKQKYGYIEEIFILNDYRKKGYGEILVKKCVDELKKSEINYILLNVWEFNEAATKFYEKLGFATRNRTLEFKNLK